MSIFFLLCLERKFYYLYNDINFMKLFYCLDVSRCLGMRLVCISFARTGNTVKNANFTLLNNYKPNFILNVIFFPVINFFLAFWTLRYKNFVSELKVWCFPMLPNVKFQLFITMNRKAVKFSKSEYAPPEILIPFGHCRLLPNLSISARRSAGK